jgi:hypothetical protein
MNFLMNIHNFKYLIIIYQLKFIFIQKNLYHLNFIIFSLLFQYIIYSKFNLIDY